MTFADFETLGLAVSAAYTAALVAWSIVAAIKVLRPPPTPAPGFDPPRAAPERRR